MNAELPHNDPREYLVELLDRQERARASVEWLERFHVAALALLCFATLAVLFHGLGTAGLGLSGGMAVLCAAALMVAQTLRIVLIDLFRQFQYRERFAIFLTHIGVLVIPGLVFELGPIEMPLAIYLVYICLFAVDAVHVGRIIALCGALLLWQAGFADPLPPAWLVCGAFFTILLAIRLGHLRFRVETYGEEQGIDLWSAARRSLLPLPLPPLAGYVVIWLLGRAMTPRRLVTEPGLIERDGSTVYLSYSEVLWQSFFLVVGIIALLLLLNWLDKQLRRRGGRVENPEGMLASTLGERPAPLGEAMGLSLADVDGTRERILAAFRQFAEQVARLGFGRGDHETAEEYWARLAQVAPRLDQLLDRGTPAFNKACYGLEMPTEAEADDFVGEVEAGMEQLREAHDARVRAAGGDSSGGD